MTDRTHNGPNDKRFPRSDMVSGGLPAIVGNGEVIAMLGVTKQRLWQIRHTPDFPRPVVDLSATPVWLRSAVEEWMATKWRRTLGRPPRIP